MNSPDEHLQHIRERYNVPVFISKRIAYTYETPPQYGTIIGANHGHIIVKRDADEAFVAYHPTWFITYLT